MKIIAESAFNHNGNLNYLKELALAAKNAGADYFTFQIYKTDQFCEKDYSKFELCKTAEFSKEEWVDFFEFCSTKNVDLIPCTLDRKSFDLCYQNGFDIIKIHATDILNIPFLEHIAKTKSQVLLETQCATKRDIQKAYDIIENNIDAIFIGFSNYPTEFEDLNLDSLSDIEKTWDVATGLADHTLDTLGIPVMALAKGCKYLEKHITLDRNNRNPDWQVSLEPEQFSNLVNNVRRYKKTLGKGVKHPVSNEIQYRDQMYKKYLLKKDVPNVEVLRSDRGLSFYEYLYSGYDKANIITAVIARLKSRRLPKKVLKPILDDALIINLMERVSQAEKTSETILATSYLEEDNALCDIVEKKKYKVYRGDPDSVIDRMLDLAEEYKAGAIYRVTGDNLFTDPCLMNLMADLLIDNDLDYVRVNNLPIGLSGELYSTNYLMHLYQTMDDPGKSEYLSWYVIQDNKGKKGCIDIKSEIKDLSQYGMTVDYAEDYERCLKLIEKIGKDKITEITLEELIQNIDLFKKMDVNDEIKLPGSKKIKYKDYLNILDQVDYSVRNELSI